MPDGSVIWSSIRMIMYSVITSSIALSAGLFGYAHALSKGKNFGCLLFKDGQHYNFNYSSCDFSISGAALAAVGFGVLVNLMGIKLGYSDVRDSPITLLVEMAIYVISSLFAVVTAIVLIVGWTITCYNVQGLGNSTSLPETTFTCSSHSDIVGPAISSIVFLSLGVFIIIQIFVFSIYKLCKDIAEED